MLSSLHITDTPRFRSLPDQPLVECEVCKLDTPEDHLIILDCPKLTDISQRNAKVCVGCAHENSWLCHDEKCQCQSVC